MITLVSYNCGSFVSYRKLQSCILVFLGNSDTSYQKRQNKDSVNQSGLEIHALILDSMYL